MELSLGEAQSWWISVLVVLILGGVRSWWWSVLVELSPVGAHSWWSLVLVELSPCGAQSWWCSALVELSPGIMSAVRREISTGELRAICGLVMRRQRGLVRSTGVTLCGRLGELAGRNCVKRA